METLSGRCHCGAVSVRATLSRPAADYAPRACDCSFCRKHGAAYVSDPAGTLAFHATDASALVRYRQGSGTAEMLLCGRCGVLVGAVFAAGEARYGVVNVGALEGVPGFAPAQVVSPQALSAAEKAARWSRLWFADVTIGTSGTAGAEGAGA